jgi:hypothetical protein
MIEDARNIRRVAEPAAIDEVLKAASCAYVSFDEWRRIDAAEIERGKQANRPRVKYIDVDEMRRAVNG